MSRHSSRQYFPLLSKGVLRAIHATQSLKPFPKFGDVSSPNLRLSRIIASPPIIPHSPSPPFLPRLSSSSLLTSMAKKHIQLGVLPRDYISRLPPPSQTASKFNQRLAHGCILFLDLTFTTRHGATLLTLLPPRYNS